MKLEERLRRMEARAQRTAEAVDERISQVEANTARIVQLEADVAYLLAAAKIKGK